MTQGMAVTVTNADIRADASWRRGDAAARARRRLDPRPDQAAAALGDAAESASTQRGAGLRQAGHAHQQHRRRALGPRRREREAWRTALDPDLRPSGPGPTAPAGCSPRAWPAAAGAARPRAGAALSDQRTTSHHGQRAVASALGLLPGSRCAIPTVIGGHDPI